MKTFIMAPCLVGLLMTATLACPEVKPIVGTDVGLEHDPAGSWSAT
jgi:hypothetical protein